MVETSRKIGIGRHLSGRLLPLAVSIGLLLSILSPITYWIIEHANLKRHARLYAVDLAAKFQTFAQEAPDLWKYQTYKFTNIVEGFHPIIDVLGFSILDEKGEPITGYGYGNGWNHPARELGFSEELRFTLGTAPIIFNNRKIGTIEVLVSDDALLRSTILLLLISSIVSTSLAFLVYRFPVKVVRRAEAKIECLLATVQESEGKYHSLVENIPDITWTADRNGNSLFLSPNIERIYGYTPEEIYAAGDSLWFGRIHPEDVERVKGAFESLFEHGVRFDVEYRMQRKDGEWIWLHDRATHTYEKDGKQYVDGIGSDITERKRAEEALRESEDKFRALAEKSMVGVYIIQDGVFRYLNPIFTDIFGYPLDELVEKMGPKDLTLPADWPTVQENLRKRLSGEIDSIHYEFRGLTKEEKVIDLEVFGARTVFHGEPAVIGALLDITDRKRAERALVEQSRKLEQLALIDELTGLYNRRGFLLLGGQQLKAAERLNKVALLIFADLDGLKEINDRFGHHEGDNALKESAAILRESSRGSDIIGRLGGDEFAVLALCADIEGAEIMASRLEQNIIKMNAGVERQYPFSLSFGVAHYDVSFPCSIDELIDRADAVMYARKIAKKGNGKQSNLSPEVTPL